MPGMIFQVFYNRVPTREIYVVRFFPADLTPRQKWKSVTKRERRKETADAFPPLLSREERDENEALIPSRKRKEELAA